MQTDLIEVDFHCHSEWSPDSRVRIADLVATARRKNLGKLVLTDHNTIAGAVLAWSLAPDLVVVGEEVMTTRGELLAFFVQEEVPAGLEPEAAIRAFRDQGAFISVSHPFDRLRAGAWELEDLLQLLPHIDAIEVFNARCMDPRANKRAAAFARQFSLPGTVGSDGHGAFELGQARLRLPCFSNTEELKVALPSAMRITRQSPFWVHLVSRWAKWSKGQPPQA